LALPREPETWLIEPLLPTAGSVLLYGDPKVGKSFAALQLASALAAGEDWLGFHIPASKTVSYIQLDTPRSLWASRVEALSGSLNGLAQLLLGDRESLQTWPFDILNPSHEALLSAIVREHEPDVVIIDTLREAHSGDENDSTAMQAVIAHLTAAVKPAALILVSHSRKSNPEFGYDLMNDNRGSNYIVGRMDAICRMSHTTIRVSGRAIDEQSIQLERLDNGLWALANDPLAMDAEKLILAGGTSVREMARLLHDLHPAKSETACRAYLRRKIDSLGTRVTASVAPGQ
jgi:hypothetical protein